MMLVPSAKWMTVAWPTPWYSARIKTLCGRVDPETLGNMHIRDPLHHHVSVKHEFDVFQALALSLNIPVRPNVRANRRNISEPRKTNFNQSIYLSIYIIQQYNNTSLIGCLRKKKKLHPMQNISVTSNLISSAKLNQFSKRRGQIPAKQQQQKLKKKKKGFKKCPGYSRKWQPPLCQGEWATHQSSRGPRLHALKP